MMEKVKMGNERLHLHSPNIHVCFRATITGNFSETNFKNALDCVTRQHPILSCLIQMDAKGEVWYVPNQSNIKLEYFQGAEMITWQEWYKKTDAVPFDFSHGPLVKVGVFCHENKTDLVILGHHILGDGLGYFNLLKDILLALDGRSQNVSLPVPEQISYINKGKIGFLAGNVAKTLNKEWRKNARLFTEEDYIQFFNEYRLKNSPGMYFNCLKGEAVTNLISACRRNNITVNEALATAFVAALQKTIKRFECEPVRLGCAASIRSESETDIAGCMGNFTTGIAVTAKYDYSKSFAENARTVSETLNQKLKNPKERYSAINFLELLEKPLIESVFYSVYGNSHNKVSHKLGELLGESSSNKGIGISNLGNQQTESYQKFNVLDIQFVPPAFPANLLTVGVITNSDRLNICLRYVKSDISSELMDRIYCEAQFLLGGNLNE